MCSTHASMMNVLHVGYNQTLDIACCMVAPQDEQDPPFQPVSLPIDTAVPVLGDVAHMVSLENMTVEEHIPPTDASGTGQVLAVTRRVSIRVGVVTGVYLGGFRQYKWPCFTTSIPAEPGMSGGLVTLPRDGNTIGACGIVCADNSTPEARSNPLQCGESVIACAWTALSLRISFALSAIETGTSRLRYHLRANSVLFLPCCFALGLLLSLPLGCRASFRTGAWGAR
jgi:hypothetical protein